MIHSPSLLSLHLQVRALCFAQLQRLEALETFDQTHSSYSLPWGETARPEQLPPPGNWRVWLILAGRGFGKTRAGAETIHSWATSRQATRIALVGASIHEARAIMVEGVSGLLSLHAPSGTPRFEVSKHRLTWPNGAQATLFGANQFERLRGPQFDAAWIDELAKFRRPEEVWNQLMLGMRLGEHPRCVVTTTPRPLPFLKELLKREDVAVTRGTTFDNAAHLPPHFLEDMKQCFEGTRLGFQELQGEILESQEGALWNPGIIFYRTPPSFPSSQSSKGNEFSWQRVVVAIDPAVSTTENSNETGIVVVGLGEDDKAYVIEDLSGKWTPHQWGKRAVEAYWHYGADRVIAEVNNGGDLVEKILRTVDPAVPFKAVRAVHGKKIRAEPVVALYEQKRVFHCQSFLELEKQMCTYFPHRSSYGSSGESHSPDRVDALVWGLTELILSCDGGGRAKIWCAL